VAARILLTDIETSPTVVATWGLHNQNMGIGQIREHPRIMGIGYKFLGDGKRARFVSEYHQSREEMLSKVRDLLDESDAVVTYNGRSFDEPWVLGELAREGLEVPSPWKSIDLYKIGKSSYRFVSHKLDYLSQALLEDRKVSTGGFSLWTDCLWGEGEVQRKAWNRMRRYCIHDVDLLEPLFLKMRPHFPATLNLAAMGGNFDIVCPVCESEHVQRRGLAVKGQRRYPRLQCQDCGKWFTHNKMEEGESSPVSGIAR
jgi:DNA polymerase elongation subunit (family B)